jgi:hypothetical protein
VGTGAERLHHFHVATPVSGRSQHTLLACRRGEALQAYALPGRGARAEGGPGAPCAALGRGARRAMPTAVLPGGICARLRGAHGVRGREGAPLAMGPPTRLSGAAPSASCGGEAPGATDGARPAPEVIAVAVEACPPARRGNWAPPERLAGGRGPRAATPHTTCALAVRGRPRRWQGASDGLLGGGAGRARRSGTRAARTAPRHDQGACGPR